MLDYLSYSHIIEQPVNFGTKRLKLGDVVRIQGEDLTYAVVVERVGKLYKAIVVTPDITLSGTKLWFRLDDLCSILGVTPVAFYITPKTVRYCLPVANIKSELKNVKAEYERMASKNWGIIRRTFFDFLARQIEVFYKEFLDYVDMLDK